MKSTKKIICLLLCAVMILSQLAACGGQGEETQHTADTTETTTAPTAVPTTTPETTAPETTVPETTVPETTVPEPTIPPFVVDGSYVYTSEEFIELLEQRLVENECPVYLEFNKVAYYKSMDLVSYRILDIASGEDLDGTQGGSTLFCLDLDSNTKEILRVEIADESGFPLIKEFTAVCMSIIDPAFEGDIYTTLRNGKTIMDDGNTSWHEMLQNGVVYQLLWVGNDENIEYIDLIMESENYYKGEYPELYSSLIEECQ